ncbi:hypothetical protein KOM00_06405 [Geomonas sp. Red69]|uniref:Cytochrome c domain-containing protein n=1 Tax=Geomonas diazotrophica TaxID=2843197 RepID=A0ABX8JP13_9BACT|nr:MULTISPECIES: hypothetical protein [Geomonas]MBU5636363.1 hypothetical protein [Geomonas diazotrophica]QWV99142.1 hypothetical protein KP005_07645 [Geomonas nitrogeniifigens]QXE88310.1 hypothetical protein KP003_07900 [Geomonas nitrogeniifigens]
MLVFRKIAMGTALLALLGSAQLTLAGQGKTADAKSVERGRYLVQIGGCNDCHTSGYALGAGKVAEEQWLTGDQLGWKGPWGTTYPANLRNFAAQMSEKQWIRFAQAAETRPPMPWYDLRAMSKEDLRAIYRYLKASGPRGEKAPAYLPPGAEPAGPYVLFPQPPK